MLHLKTQFRESPMDQSTTDEDIYKLQTILSNGSKWFIGENVKIEPLTKNPINTSIACGYFTKLNY